MFLNYFRTAWRSLLRDRLYTILNVLGLATGMAVALLIGLWVNDQLTYDCFFLALASLVAVVITAGTISVQALRAAGANPASSLRSE